MANKTSSIMVGLGVAFGLAELGIAAEDSLSAFERQQDVVYAQVHGVGLLMDVFVPTNDANGIGIIDVASGAWSSDRGKIRDHERAQVFSILCSRGFTVFAVRPGSLSRFSGADMVDHVERSIRWVREQAENFSIDAQRLGLMGASAGGHLASWVALRDVEPVAAVAVFFPPTDFLNFGDVQIDVKQQDGLGRMLRHLAFSDGIEGQSDEQIQEGIRQISPAYHVTDRAPPFLIIHGDADPVVPLQQSQRLVSELKQHNIEAELIIKPGGGHPWPTIHEEVAKLADWFEAQLLTTTTAP